jgi:HEPN domain-containing protein
MSTPAERWADQATYDLDSARAMLQSGRYLYVLFCCQQAVEKMLKAVIVERSKELPPRIHHLGRLAETAGLAPDDSQTDFLGELTAYYIESRYPEEMESLAEQATREIASDTLRKTEETFRWLHSARR